MPDQVYIYFSTCRFALNKENYFLFNFVWLSVGKSVYIQIVNILYVFIKVSMGL